MATVASHDDWRTDTPVADEARTASPSREIIRDIARGGFAGGLVGIAVIGVGGRLVMRLATILHEDAVGSITDNGNRIGAITLDGTFGLLFNGFIVGLMAGTLWVIVSPWMGRAGLTRAVLAVPLGIALAISGLIQDEPGRDFSLLGHDPAVVVGLIVLVGLAGFSLAATDGWLDARLPHPTSDHPFPSAIYPVFALLGAVIIFPIVVASYFLTGTPEVVREGVAIVAVGLSTLTWWVLRVRGERRPPMILLAVGRGALVVAAGLGVAAAIPGLERALG